VSRRGPRLGELGGRYITVMLEPGEKRGS